MAGTVTQTLPLENPYEFPSWDDIRAFGSDVWNDVKAAGSEAWDGIRSFGSDLVDTGLPKALSLAFSLARRNPLLVALTPFEAGRGSDRVPHYTKEEWEKEMERHTRHEDFLTMMKTANMDALGPGALGPYLLNPVTVTAPSLPRRPLTDSSALPVPGTPISNLPIFNETGTAAPPVEGGFDPADDDDFSVDYGGGSYSGTESVTGGGSLGGNGPGDPKNNIFKRLWKWSKENPGKAITAATLTAFLGYQTVNHIIPTIVNAWSVPHVGSSVLSVPMWPPYKGWIYDANKKDTTPNLNLSPDEEEALKQLINNYNLKYDSNGLIMLVPKNSSTQLSDQNTIQLPNLNTTQLPDQNITPGIGDKEEWFDIETNDPNLISNDI